MSFISKYSPLVLIVIIILIISGIFNKVIDCFSVENFSALFFEDSKENENEGYEYLMEINKKNKGRLLKDSITGQLIDN